MAAPRWSDASILSQVIGLHYYHEPITLDASFGGGRMWKGCPYQPSVRFDQRALPGVDVVGSWDQLPQLFAPQYFQLVVWDPPHQTNGGVDALGGRWPKAYGTAAVSQDLKALNISGMYPGFLAAARQVLLPSGLLLAKIADQTHNGLQQLQAVDFVIACRNAAWSVCEMLPKMRPPGPMDPKWRRQYHIRKAWSYWIAAHPGPQCTAVGVPLVRSCAACGRDFRAQRRHAKTCSGACRSALHDTLSRSARQQESVSNR